MKAFIVLLLLTVQFSMAQDNIGKAVLIRKNNKDKIEVRGFANQTTKEKVDATTNFRMASVSKQFTAACIILLKNRGLLSYDDRLSTYFPNFKTGKTITIRHLLTHSSGLMDYENLIPKTQTHQVTDADVVRWVGSTDSTYFMPGTAYRYSNSGFCILAEIVAKVSEIPYAKFIEQAIFEPLKMDQSFIYNLEQPQSHRALGYALKDAKVMETDQSITSATKGDGCLYTSLTDYKKWINAIAQNTLFNLKKELVLVNFQIKPKVGLYYGLGWFNVDGKELYHTGSTSGFSNVVWMTLDGKNALVYFSNLTDNHSSAYLYESRFKKAFPFKKVLALTD